MFSFLVPLDALSIGGKHSFGPNSSLGGRLSFGLDDGVVVFTQGVWSLRNAHNNHHETQFYSLRDGCCR